MSTASSRETAELAGIRLFIDLLICCSRGTVHAIVEVISAAADLMIVAIMAVPPEMFFAVAVVSEQMGADLQGSRQVAVLQWILPASGRRRHRQVRRRRPLQRHLLQQPLVQGAPVLLRQRQRD